MKDHQSAITVAIVVGILASALAGYAETDESAVIKELREQIQQLDQKVRILERRGELAQDVAVEKSKTLPLITLGANGFNFSSADSNFVAQIHGLVQFDSRTFFQDAGVQNNDSFLLRRARPIISGTVFHDFDYLFVPDFGGTTVQIVDANLTYRYSPEFQVQAGKFKPSVGLEQLQSDTALSFNERSLVTDLLPNRDIGIQVKGDLFGGLLSYAAGIFNGVSDFNSTTSNSDPSDDLKGFAGRLFAQPFKNSTTPALRGIGFGVGASYGTERGANTTPGYKTDGQHNLFTYTNAVADGTHWRISPQASYYYGPFSLVGEYAVSDQRVSRTTAPVRSAELQNKAWQVTAGWVLTGEDASYTGVTPRHTFDPRNGQWGAFQIVGRYETLDIDDQSFTFFANPNLSATEARAWSVGLNWYLNRDLRVNTSYSHTAFSGGNGTGSTVTRQPEDVLFTRIQLAF